MKICYSARRRCPDSYKFDRLSFLKSDDVCFQATRIVVRKSTCTEIASPMWRTEFRDAINHTTSPSKTAAVSIHGKLDSFVDLIYHIQLYSVMSLIPYLYFYARQQILQ